MYVKEESGKEILIPTKLGKEDMAVKKQWWIFGADASTVGRVADARAVWRVEGSSLLPSEYNGVKGNSGDIYVLPSNRGS
jgi:hypothetical protein